MTPFVFLSHGSADKDDPRFAEVVLALHAKGIPLGIDSPEKLPKDWAGSIPFVWSLPNGGHWDEELNRGQIDAVGALFLASSNTPRGSYVWREFSAACALKGERGDRFDWWGLNLESDPHASWPEDIKSRHIEPYETALAKVIEEIAAHLARVRDERRQLFDAAMLQTVENNRHIEIVGKKLTDGEFLRLPLDQVYTALRGDILSAAERKAASTALSGGAYSVLRGTRLNIAEAVRDNPVLVILGEPASGKSTLLRWLASRFAAGWVEQGGATDGIVHAAERHVDPDKPGDEPIEIGPMLFPVLIPMEAVTKALSGTAQPDLLLVVAERVAALVKAHGEPATSLDGTAAAVRELAAAGRLLVLLDGLDEVGEASAREEAVKLVEKFAGQWTAESLTADIGVAARRNRLVMTSRIVGYAQVRVPDTWPHVIVDRMSEDTVKLFLKRVFRAFEVADPDASATTLHDHVFGEHGSSIEDIAGIPLLAVMLAHASRDHGGVLPNRRVEIYDKMTRHLVEEQRRARPIDFDFQRWKRWLCVVAKEMQERNDGLISAEDYDRLLLKRYRELDEGTTLRLFEQEELVRQFRRENDDRVGLLVQRAGEQHGFPHRTFQEYLAAAWLMDEAWLEDEVGLVREPGKMVDRLIDKWDDPAWREAALLAFGHESLRGPAKAKSREALVDALFQRTEPHVHSRLAYFLCQALSEMPDPPSERMVVAILTAMVAGLHGEPLAGQSSLVRKRLTDAMYTLADREPHVFEKCLVHLMKTGDAAAVNTFAVIVQAERWRTPEIIDALKVALGRREGARDPSVSEALRQALSEIVVQQGKTEEGDLPKPKRPSLSDDMEEVDIRTAARLLAGRQEHIHRMRRWRVAKILSTNCRLRPLRSYEPILNAAEGDRAWRAVAIGLLGTLGDKDTIRGTAEYRHFARWLREPDTIREQRIDDDPTLIGQFGADDTVYQSAVYLDTHGGTLLGDGRAPAFDRRVAYPATPFPDGLFDAAERLVSSPESLSVSAIDDESGEGGALAFLAACLANIDGQFPVQERLAALTPLTLAQLRALAERTGTIVAEPAFRALRHLVRNLPKDTVLARRVELALVQAFETCARSSGTALESIPQNLVNAGARARAEYLSFELAMIHTDDPVKDTASALDIMAALPLAERLDALRLMAEAACRRFAGDFAAGPDVPLPLTGRPGDLPPQIFDLPGNDRFASQQLLIAAAICGDALRDVVAPDMQAALAPYMMLVPLDYLYFARPTPGSAIAAIEALADPYMRCRGFLAIGECGIGDTQSYFQRARETVGLIGRPIERFIVLDRLLELGVGSFHDALVEQARDAALAIDDPREGWRAFARVSTHIPDAKLAQFAEAIAMIDRIADPEERLDHWLAARRSLGDDLLRARSAPPPASGEPIRDAAFVGIRAPLLLALDSLPDFDGDATLALYVAQTCHDIIDAIDIVEGKEYAAGGNIDAAERLADHDIAPHEAEVILARIERDSPVLTFEWAKLVQSLAERAPARASRLASLMRIEGLASLAHARAWLQSDNPALAFSATAAIVRKSPRRDQAYLSVLLAGVTSDDDLQSIEACRLLTRGTLGCSRPRRLSTTADYGINGLLELGRFVVRAENRSIRCIAQCALLDVIHDDAEIVSRLCDLADTRTADGAAAQAVLSETVTDDPILLDLLGRRFGQASFETQRALIDAFAATAYEFGKAPVIDVALSVSSLIKRPIRFLAGGGADVVAAAAAAIEGGGPLDRQLGVARECLVSGAIDLCEHLRDAGSARAVLRAQYSSRTRNLGDGLPVLHGRQEIEHFRQQFGIQGVTLLGAWLATLLLDDDYEDEALAYLAVAASDIGRRNPAILAEAMAAQAGSPFVLREAIARCINGPVGIVTGSFTLATGCLIAPIGAAMAEALLQSVKSPLPDAFRSVEAVVLSSSTVVSAEALPILEAALEGSKARVAFIAIRLLGALIRKPGLSSQIHRRGRLALEALVAGDRSNAGVFLFSPVGEKLEGASIMRRGTLRDAALQEIARAET